MDVTNQHYNLGIFLVLIPFIKQKPYIILYSIKPMILLMFNVLKEITVNTYIKIHDNWLSRRTSFTRNRPQEYFVFDKDIFHFFSFTKIILSYTVVTLYLSFFLSSIRINIRKPWSYIILGVVFGPNPITKKGF